MLKALDCTKNEQIAFPGLRGQKFTCPGCNDEVLLKAGRFKIAHFAHRKNSACMFGARESALHLGIKNFLYQELKRITPNVTVEQKIGNHVTDVYAKIEGFRFAFEVQLSPITWEEIVDRMRAYTGVGAATVWVVHSDAIASYVPTEVDGERIKIRRWWMPIQKMQLGVTLFGTPKFFSFARLTEATTWRDGGDFGNSYEYSLKTFRTISLSPGKICFSRLIHRKCNETGLLTYSIPREMVWWV